ncbi:MAG: alpha/beta hydrolase [Verrucomicrobiota bacterium]|nr:alpha/beta hydrolase [Verrucomicrobiota bacterium]
MEYGARRRIPLPLADHAWHSDGVTSAEASREFAERAGTACTLKIWEGLYHELHNEPEKQAVSSYYAELAG